MSALLWVEPQVNFKLSWKVFDTWFQKQSSVQAPANPPKVVEARAGSCFVINCFLIALSSRLICDLLRVSEALGLSWTDVVIAGSSVTHSSSGCHETWRVTQGSPEPLSNRNLAFATSNLPPASPGVMTNQSSWCRTTLFCAGLRRSLAGSPCQSKLPLVPSVDRGPLSCRDCRCQCLICSALEGELLLHGTIMTLTLSASAWHQLSHRAWCGVAWFLPAVLILPQMMYNLQSRLTTVCFRLRVKFTLRSFTGLGEVGGREIRECATSYFT